MNEFEKWWDDVGKYSNGDTYSQSKFTFEAGAATQREKDAKICDKWQPIEIAPKDGRYLMVGNEDGVWVACYTPTFQSGFRPDNPWISLMLNHRHIEKVKRNYSSVPTHWMPLPAPPKVGADKTAYDPVKALMDIPPIEGGL